MATTDFPLTGDEYALIITALRLAQDHYADREQVAADIDNLRAKMVAIKAAA